MRADAEIDWDAYVVSAETRELVRTVREHFASLVDTDDIRRVIDGASPRDLWPDLRDHGYPLIGMPEECDGVGSVLDLVVVLEAAGRALLPAPLLATSAALQTMRAAGLLASVSAGSPVTVATSNGAGYLFAFDAAMCEALVVVDAHGDGGSVVRHLRTAPDAARRLPGVDPSRANLCIPEAGTTVIASAELAADHNAVLAAARTCVAADLVGIAAGALDASIGHVLTREQFGRTLATFQAVKHMLADTYVAVERGWSLTLGAAVEAGRDPLGPEARRLAMLAKAAASEAAQRSTAVQTQLLGAMGLSFESDSPLAVRRVHHTAPFLGTPSELYARVAADSLAEAAR